MSSVTSYVLITVQKCLFMLLLKSVPIFVKASKIW